MIIEPLRVERREREGTEEREGTVVEIFQGREEGRLVEVVEQLPCF